MTFVSKPAGAYALVVLVLQFVCFSSAWAQVTDDTEAPQLVSLDFTPKSVDVSASSQSVTFTLRATDDISGFYYGSVYLRGPSGQSASRGFNTSDLVSGDGADGAYEFSVSIPHLAEAGTWNLNSVQLRDNVGNYRTFRQTELEAAGFPTTVEVASGTPDTEGPELAALNFTPQSTDVSASSQSITFTVRATDDISGFSYGSVYLRSPSGQQNASGGFNTGSYYLTSGDGSDGTYEVSVTIPQHAEAGTWNLIQVQLRDNVGNSRTIRQTDLEAAGFPTTVEVASSTPDMEGPELAALNFTPQSTDVSASSQSITFTVGATDDISGFSYGSVHLRSPSGQQNASRGFNTGSYYLISGDAADGVYQFSVTIPQFAEAGTWNLIQVGLRDNVGNYHTIRQTDLEAAGFPTSLELTYAQYWDCTATTLSEPTYGSSDGLGTATITFTNADGLEEINFTRLTNLTAAAPENWEAAGSDSFTPEGAAPQTVSFTLTQQDPTAAEATYYAEAFSTCPGEDTGRLRTVFDPPLNMATATSAGTTGLPNQVTVESAYPNPFNPQTTIRFALPEALAVRAEVYDAVGRRVAVLMAGETMQAGWHELQFEAASLPSGLYLMRLQAGQVIETQRLTLVK